MSGMADHLHLIVLFPLLGAIVVGALGNRLGRGASAAVACLAVFASFLAALSAHGELAAAGQPLHQVLFRWLSVGPLEAPFALHFDRLSAVMALTVTGVGFLIHAYSAGLMTRGPGFARQFACLNLFVFFLLLLVLAANLPLLFVGWEGVALCIYLLAGFRFEDPARARAGMRAFLTHRAGDIGFVAGMLLLAFEVERATGRISLDFQEMQGAVAFLGDHANAAPFLGVTSVAWALLLLFLGAAAKSAQFPLFGWLQDAQDGPAPGSALLHAVAMGASGVYLICRLHPFLLLVPNGMAFVAWVGAATALLAATVAAAQTDLQRGLAWLTVSQLGTMFLALGAGAFAAGIFLFVAHACFAGLLFLAAGAVIRALHGERDIRRMGGLARTVRATFALFAAGGFALCALPPGAGFHAREAILHAAVNSATAGAGIFAVGLLTGALIAYAMSRLVIAVFHAPPARGIDPARAVESPAVMLAPMAVLALLALLGGFLPVPAFLKPVFAGKGLPEIRAVSHGLVGLLTAVAALSGVAFAWRIHLARPREAERLARAFAAPRGFVARAGRLDELGDALLVRPALAFGKGFERFAEAALLDGLIVHGLAGTARAASRAARALQRGPVQETLLALFAGALLLLWLLAR